jgi:hypothetical protein
MHPQAQDDLIYAVDGGQELHEFTILFKLYQGSDNKGHQPDMQNNRESFA